MTPIKMASSSTNQFGYAGAAGTVAAPPPPDDNPEHIAQIKRRKEMVEHGIELYVCVVCVCSCGVFVSVCVSACVYVYGINCMHIVFVWVYMIDNAQLKLY
jgi:hypothetical protein